MAIGDWAGRMAGGWTGILLGAVSGCMSGVSIDRQIQAETERLQQEFHVLLQAYDQAMGILITKGVDLLAYHGRELIAAIRKAR